MNNNIYSPINQIDQEKEQKETKNRHVKLTIVGIAVLVIGLVGVTYAFFNYTRTGSSNVLKVGRISFNSVQGPSINLTNVFPIDREDIDTDTDNVGSVTINVTGSTDYSEGVEYLISTVDVENFATGDITFHRVPISVDIDYSPNAQGKTIGTENDNYFDDGVRGGNTSYYKVISTSFMRNEGQLVVGYIAPGQTGIDGNITIKAFLDKDKIGISDTYPSGEKAVVNPNMNSTSINYCVSYFTSLGWDQALLPGETLNAFCAGTGTLNGAKLQSWLMGGAFSSEQIRNFNNNGVVLILNNGTPVSFGEGRTVLSTDEWNSLQQSGLSFKVKVEANEGIWVDNPGKIKSCPDCKFMHVDDDEMMYTTWNTMNETPTIINEELTDDYLNIIENYGNSLFFGLVLNNSNQVTKAYVCGLKDDMPFCVEGTNSNSLYLSNTTLLQSEKLWNNTCFTSNENEGTENEHEELHCVSDIPPTVSVHDHGCVEMVELIEYPSLGIKECGVYNAGGFGCYYYDINN